MSEVPLHAEAGNAQRGVRLAQEARDAGCTLKLLGGVAVWHLCPSAQRPPLARDYADIDFATVSGQTRAATDFLQSHGYEADRLFNSLHGASRLRFEEAATGRPLDVIVDRFLECHELDLRDRLGGDGLAIPLADLLLTKLQVVELNQKDLRDLAAIFADHALDSAPASIEVARVVDLASRDWGLEHTIRRTLDRLLPELPHLAVDATQAEVIASRVGELQERLDQAPKSLRWRLRAQVGERVRWYELPEEPRR